MGLKDLKKNIKEQWKGNFFFLFSKKKWNPGSAQTGVAWGGCQCVETWRVMTTLAPPVPASQGLALLQLVGCNRISPTGVWFASVLWSQTEMKLGPLQLRTVSWLQPLKIKDTRWWFSLVSRHLGPLPDLDHRRTEAARSWWGLVWSGMIDPALAGGVGWDDLLKSLPFCDSMIVEHPKE